MQRQCGGRTRLPHLVGERQVRADGADGQALKQVPVWKAKGQQRRKAKGHVSGWWVPADGRVARAAAMQAHASARAHALSPHADDTGWLRCRAATRAAGQRAGGSPAPVHLCAQLRVRAKQRELGVALCRHRAQFSLVVAHTRVQLHAPAGAGRGRRKQHTDTAAEPEQSKSMRVAAQRSAMQHSSSSATRRTSAARHTTARDAACP